MPIQAVIGKRVIARETLSQMRADVTAGLYGGESLRASGAKQTCLNFPSEGHYERKLKHLNNQKESKKLMKKVGTVELPQEAFFSLLKTKS